MKQLIKTFLIRWIQKIVKQLFFYKNNENLKIVPEKLNKILIIRLDEIGDVVMTSPLLRELRRNYPNAEITLVVKPQVYNLVELCPYVNHVLTYQYESGRFAFFQQIIKIFIFSKKYLVKENYDLTILPRWDADYYSASMLAYFSGAKKRLAYSENVNELKKRINQGYDGFFTDIIDDKVLKHEVERNLYFIKYLKGNVQNTKLEVWINEEDKKWAEKFLKENQISRENILIGLAPSARDPRRKWADTNFNLLIMKLILKFADLKIIIFGGNDASEFAGNIKKDFSNNVIDLTAQTTLRQAAILMKYCNVYLGNNTGLLHFAAAWGVPCIELSCHPKDCDPNHQLSPVRFQAWGTKTKVLRPEHTYEDCIGNCQKKYSHCINQITVEEVLTEIKSFCKIDCMKTKL